MSVGVEVGELVCKTKLSVVLLFFCHLQERIKVVLLTRSRMSLCTLGVWGSAFAFQLCCGWSVILASAAEPSPARMSGTIIARLAPFKTSRYASA